MTTPQRTQPPTDPSGDDESARGNPASGVPGAGPGPSPEPGSGPSRPGIPGSRVLGIPAASPEAALGYFLHARLACETDPYDVHHDLAAGVPGFVLVDARSKAAFEEECLPGALGLPHAELTDAVLSGLDPEPVYVTYGWGPACNAGSRAAAKLAAAGFRVKEMLGGLEYWKRQDHPTTKARR